MNVLQDYTFNVSGFSYSAIKQIFNNKHNRYYYKRVADNLYIIVDRNSNKVQNLKCVNKIYTTNSNGKMIKMAKGNAVCFNCKKLFDIPSSYNCIDCNSYMLQNYKQKQFKIVKK